MCSSASGSTSPAPRNFRSGRRLTATNSLLHSIRRSASTPGCGVNTASIAECGGSGVMRQNRSGGWCTSLAERSMRAGSSITMRPQTTMTRPDTGSRTTPFGPANMSRFVMQMARCTRFRLSRWRRQADQSYRRARDYREILMTGANRQRTAAEVLVDQLVLHGVRHVFCVPGESYIAALDALHDRPIDVTVCRHESGAAMMAEACGKATGRPGICFVTRGPGATNAAAGVHIAHQDSTPLILFVGQIARGMREREAFQELDYRAVFGSMTNWATEMEDPHRIPELISRAFYTA